MSTHKLEDSGGHRWEIGYDPKTPGYFAYRLGTIPGTVDVNIDPTQGCSLSYIQFRLAAYGVELEWPMIAQLEKDRARAESKLGKLWRKVRRK